MNPSRKPTSPEQTQENEVYPEATVLYWQNDAWEHQPSTRFMGFITCSTHPGFESSRIVGLSVLVASMYCRCKRVQHRQASRNRYATRLGQKWCISPLSSMPGSGGKSSQEWHLISTVHHEEADWSKKCEFSLGSICQKPDGRHCQWSPSDVSLNCLIEKTSCKHVLYQSISPIHYQIPRTPKMIPPPGILHWMNG